MAGRKKSGVSSTLPRQRVSPTITVAPTTLDEFGTGSFVCRASLKMMKAAPTNWPSRRRDCPAPAEIRVCCHLLIVYPTRFPTGVEEIQRDGGSRS